MRRSWQLLGVAVGLLWPLMAQSGSSRDGSCEADSFKYNMALSSPYGVDPSPYSSVFMPLYSSRRLDDINADIRTVVIGGHGYSRNAEEYFCIAMKSIQDRADVMVVVPFFSDVQLLSAEWGYDLIPNSASVYWSTSNWMKGANNSPSPGKFTSSFDILDDIIEALSNAALYPSLVQVTFAGFSAGAQTFNRYSWASSVGLPPTVATSTLSSPFVVRFILSDASSYLYFNDIRPDSAKCCQLESPDVRNQLEFCDNFGPLSESTIYQCPKYNDWKYGVDNIPTSGYAYLEDLLDNDENVALNSANLRFKDVKFLMGDLDFCNCNQEGYVNDPYTCYPEDAAVATKSRFQRGKNYSLPRIISVEDGLPCDPSDYGGIGCCDTFPDSTNNVLSVTCESMLQGSNRLQRGLNYIQYLSNFWAESNFEPDFQIVKGMSHNSTAFYESEQFKFWAYAT